MMRTRALVLAATLMTAASGPLAAQGSVFAIRGLGWSARPVSARGAGAAGSLAMFDPAMGVNPATLSRWRSVAAWMTAAPSRRKFDGPTGTASLTTTRFPLFGFATQLPPRISIGISISDYLDRTWTVHREDSVVLRGVTEQFTEAGRSIGGISDLRLAASYRLRPDVHVGIGLHYYLGSTVLTAQRLFDNPAYLEIIEQSQTDFRAGGVSAGIEFAVGRVDVGASARLNTSLTSNNTGGPTSSTSMPNQLGFGLRYQVVPGIFLSGAALYDGWGRADAELTAAGGEHARNVWSLSAGAEVLSATLIKLRTPLRIGYRWRQLPFTSLDEPLSERAVSAGVGFSFAADRTSLDVSAERGSRQAGAARETFSSLFVGLTVRP